MAPNAIGRGDVCQAPAAGFDLAPDQARKGRTFDRRAADMKTSAPGARIRSLFLGAFLDAASNDGVKLTHILRRHHISASRIGSPYAWLPLQRYVATTEAIALEARNGFLGLDVGKNFDLADLGPFYTLCAIAPSLAAVLGAFVRFQCYWQTCTTLRLERQETATLIRYRIGDPSIWPRIQDTEFTMAALTAAIRQTIGPNWRPVGIELEHDTAGRADRLAAFFGAPVRGNRQRNAIIVPNSTMDAPTLMHSRLDFERLQPIVERHLIDLLHSGETEQSDLVDRTRALIAERLGVDMVDMGVIADHLGVPQRTLRRRLSAGGTTFRKLLEDQRRIRALQLLQGRHDIPLDELSERLGYADQASFSRAFKSWTGLSPRRYVKSRTV